VEVSADGKTLTLSRGGKSLLQVPVDGFQLGLVEELNEGASYDPYWLNDPNTQTQTIVWRAATSAKVRSSSDSKIELDLQFEKGAATLSIESRANGGFAAHFQPTVSDGLFIAYMRIQSRADSKEGFYGLGEWGDSVNHRGKWRPMQIEVDLSSDSGSLENHVVVPLLIGTRGWGLFVESHRPGVFDVATKDDTLVEVTFGTAADSDAGLKFHLFGAEHPLDVTKQYYDVTGYPRLPATWALGPWIWRDENRDQAQVIDDIKHINDLDLPTSGYWIDRPYASGVNAFDFHPTMFPDPGAMIQALHDNGLRVALWHTPYAAGLDGNEPALLIHDEAKTKGYFVPKSGLKLNKWGTPIDFTNPDAYSWWQSLIHRYTDNGIEGFKLDYGEDVQLGVSGARNAWRFFDGSDERTMHHGYILKYHQIYNETLPKDGGFLLCRTGRWGDQVNGPIIWPGDLDADMSHEGELNKSGKKKVGGLPASLIKDLSLGPSGFPFYGSDSGGYRSSPPNNETFVRWFSQTALSTVMQTGNSASDTPWEINEENGRNEETLPLYRKFAQLHIRLFPYEWTYAQNLAKDGRPISRALGLAYPELGVHPNDEYLFGDSLLVAPVVEAGQTKRKVIVPPGEWLGWWKGESVSGSASEPVEITVEAPLGELPLFIRAGGIVPMLRPNVRTLAPVPQNSTIQSYANDPGVLYVRIAPSAQASAFELFDGAKVSQQKQGTGADVAFDQGTKFTKGALFEVIATSQPSSVTRDGTALTKRESIDDLESATEGWFWESSISGTVWVKVPAGSSKINIR
jgi:alpha-D-xyloside xylohydrolase